MMTSDLPSPGASCAVHTQLHTQHGSHKANACLCPLSSAFCQATQNLQLCLSRALSRLRHAAGLCSVCKSRKRKRPAQACPWSIEALRRRRPFVRKSRLKGEHRHGDAMRLARNQLCAAPCWLCWLLRFPNRQLRRLLNVGCVGIRTIRPQRISGITQASLDERRHHWKAG
jgi:hypothetical protein